MIAIQTNAERLELLRVVADRTFKEKDRRAYFALKDRMTAERPGTTTHHQHARLWRRHE